jgi:hypothetical protein
MSEINSIAQGTYTLGQTSATTYQAGPGISITQPSEGTVRISNDETVLWSAADGATSGDMILSESWKNFEKISVTHACTYGGNRPIAPDTVIDTYALTKKGGGIIVCSDQTTTEVTGQSGNNKIFYETQVTFSAINDTTLRFYPAYVKFINYPKNDGTVTGRYGMENSRVYYNIVGINRISGGNA